MSPRSILILVSLAANVFLIFSLNSASRRIKEARQLSLLEDTDLNRVRDLSGRVQPKSGLNASAVTQDLAILAKVRAAVAEQVNGKSNRADLKCPQASRGELDQMISQMEDYRKKLDALLSGPGRSDQDKEDVIRKIEDEASKIKMELMSQCAR